MQGKIFLNTREGQQLKNGAYPLICELTGNGKQKSFSLKMKFLDEEWNYEKQEPKKDKAKTLIIRRKKSLLDDLLIKSIDDPTITLDYVKKALTGKLTEVKDDSVLKVDFFKYGYELAEEKRQLVSAKGILKEGNAESYITALNQLKKVKPVLDISEIDYKLLTDFKNLKLKQGIKKNSISAYMRALKAIYNECLKVNKIKIEHQPFEGIFSGISTKRNRTKKRNLPKESIKILESFNNSLVKGQQLAIDMFLLQFYFGGQDLFDIYYLEKTQLSNDNRIYFLRGKLDDGGYEFDLKIFPKADLILKSFVSRDNFIISGRKDHNGYKNYIKRINNNLKLIQKKYNEHIYRIEKITNKEYHKLEVQPLGGDITTKVARHTFSTIAKRMYVDPDLLRSLMGHERDDVDTIYKDVYLEQERDKHHKDIIDTSDIKTEVKEIYCYEFLNSDRKRDYKYKYFDNTPKESDLVDKTSGKKYTKPKFFNQIHLILK